ncbi:MAG: HAD family hydrolase [Chitinophagaceae bacterium]
MRLFIFDIDGTVTNTKAVDDHCFINSFERRYNVRLGKIDWAEFENVTDKGLYEELYRRYFNSVVSGDEMAEFQKDFFTLLESHQFNSPELFTEIPGAAAFVNYCIQRSEIKIAFATGGWGHSAQLKLTASSIPYLGFPLSNSDNFHRRQDILTNAIQQSKLYYQDENLEQVLYFGDGVWDLATTRELQIPFIGVDYKRDDKLRKAGATTIVFDFEEPEKVVELCNCL